MLDDAEKQDGNAADGERPDEGQKSLFAEVETLVEDGKTYAEAELSFQKNRLLYAAGKAKSAAVYVGIAAIFVVLAIVALVLGAVLALTPVLGALGATGAVFAALLIFAILLVLGAKAKVASALRAFEDKDGQA
jgi:uncharacterized membrane protein YqjE